MSFFRDIRHGVRMLIKSPGVSAIAVVALALGIGVTATMFSIVYGALLRGLPFEKAGSTYAIRRIDIESGDGVGIPIHDYLDWRARQSSFETLAGFYTGTVNLRIGEAAERYDGSFVSANTFDVAGVPAAIGRTFLPGEDTPAAEPVILLSHELWRDRFGADPGIVGWTVRANGEQMTVVGVMPEGFWFPLRSDVWLPLRLDGVALPRGEGTTLNVTGVLREGIDLEQASAEMSAIARQLADEHPETNEDRTAEIIPFVEQYIGDEPVALLYTALGAVFLVLAIACANVANLLLSRAFDRNKEVAIRTALGANRRRVIAQILAEAGVLAAAGAAAGVVMARFGVAWFNAAIAGSDPPPVIDIRVDAPILLFVLGVTSLATLLAGTLPALQVTRSNLNEVLADESRGSSSFKMGRLSRGLVVLQVALSCGLLVAAGLMIKSVVKLGSADWGFEPDAVFTARLGLFPSDYPEVEDRRRFVEQLHARLEGRADVIAASLTPSLPVTGSNVGPVRIEGESYADAGAQPLAHQAGVTPGFFATFDIDVLQGRDFTVEDAGDGLPVAIVNQSFADELLEGRDPLGKRFAFGSAGSDGAETWLTVVGVVPDLYMDGPTNERPEGFYVPLSQADAQFLSIAVRTRGEPLAFAPSLRQEVLAVDPDLPLYWVRPMTDVIHEQTWFYWVFGTLFTIFGSVALLLASVGLYGVMSFAVRRRTAEVGIRMALGASSGDVLGLVIRQGLVQLGLGLALGLLMARGLASLLQAILYQVEPTDATTFTAIAGTLLAVGLLACLVPALRAARVDPMIALRNP
ncbi:MAG TPA: ABC transporter permease [Acidobacteriota bacterium]